jgi:hypothetical protein
MRKGELVDGRFGFGTDNSEFILNSWGDWIVFLYFCVYVFSYRILFCMKSVYAISVEQSGCSAE